MPKKKPTKKSYLEMSGNELVREYVLREYDKLHQTWQEELQNDSTDWSVLFDVYYKLAIMEQRSPWLKKEALA